MNQGSSTNKDGNNQGEMRRHPWESVVTDLKCFTYYDLRRATENLGDDKRYLNVYKGWIDKTTYSPTEDNTGLAIAVKRIDFYKTACWVKCGITTSVGYKGENSSWNCPRACFLAQDTK
ncbi:unnamed protein product [Lactuca virosa]|uniref:Uncharacterized protein n=1 Tax=Lactuca virosa TaxID=75947 RepID=A0AAU9MH75_9ASTR|nr:unnamed protein product [Lactuca virosa]